MGTLVWKMSIVGAALIAVSGCATRRPVLYPNPKLNEVGHAVARRDIEECKHVADGLVQSRATGDTAKRTVTGGAVGAAAGAAGGAIWGNAGRGAASGAAGGAAAGLVSSLFSAPEPSGTYKNAVNICLAERGYRVIGWE